MSVDLAVMNPVLSMSIRDDMTFISLFARTFVRIFKDQNLSVRRVYGRNNVINLCLVLVASQYVPGT